MFYNTGIATYVWVLTNRKPEHRKGKVQLIDATKWYTPLKRNMGQKNCELSDEDTRRICETFLNFEESDQSKIFPERGLGVLEGDSGAPAPRSMAIDPEKDPQCQGNQGA